MSTNSTGKTRYTLTAAKTGEVIVTGRTEKQAVALARLWRAEASIVGTDGVSYRLGSRALVPVDHVAPAVTMTERELNARVSDMTQRPLQDGDGDDNEAIEDLGLGTVDGGLYSHRGGQRTGE